MPAAICDSPPTTGSGVFFGTESSIMDRRRPKKTPDPLAAALLTTLAIAISGCAMTPRQYWEKLKGDGFPGWSEAMGSGVRANKDARPSGFFTDRRSEQIEKDLGGF